MVSHIQRMVAEIHIGTELEGADHKPMMEPKLGLRWRVFLTKVNRQLGRVRCRT